MSDKEKMIQLKGISQAHPLSAINFLKEFQEKLEEGYVLHPCPRGKQIPNFVGFPSCIMVTKEYAEELMAPQEPVSTFESVSEPVSIVVAEDVKNELEAASKKDELLAIAEKIGLVVPEDKKVPKAIKQFILNSIA